MTQRDGDYDGTVSPDERIELDEVAVRLESQRPVPNAVFRGELRRRLDAVSPNVTPHRARARMRRRAYACLAAGTALMLLAAAGVADLGPLAPGDVAEAVAWIVP